MDATCMDQSNRMASPNLPLAGCRVLVTRSRAQASVLATKLAAQGAEPVELPLIAFEDPLDGGAALQAAVQRLDDYAWVVLTSPNGANRFVATVDALDGVPLANVKIATVGTATAEVLRDRGLTVHLVPDRQVAEGLLAVFPRPVDADHNRRVLLPQADAARRVMADELAALGWSVDRVVAYRTIEAMVSDDQRRLAATTDVVTFTSSSTVTQFCDLVGEGHLPPVVACIGPITAATARDRGLTVDVEASDHSLDGLVQALVAFVQSSP